MRYILGLSAYYHDSAAALLRDGQVVAAAQQERFTRLKHDPGFPTEAIRYCLAEANIALSDVDAVAFYDKPLLKFERLLETYLAFAPKGLKSFVTAMPVWLKEKLLLKQTLRRELAAIAGPDAPLPPLLFDEHHAAHAASAFFPSPFERAAVLCLDGVGEWATTSIWIGEGRQLTPVREIQFPHSLGLLYSAFTYFCGFRVNSGEYKLMGLAPYGEPRFVHTMLDHLIDLKADGSFRLDLRYFDYCAGLRMTSAAFDALFEGPPCPLDGQPGQREMDLARSIQVVTEEIVLRLVRSAQRDLDVEHCCLAGGVALNCVANGRLLREGPFKGLWIQPAAGDAGGALGAALNVWHQHQEQPRAVQTPDAMQGAYLGPAWDDAAIPAVLDQLGAVYHTLANEAQLLEQTAALLAEGKVVGWHQGRMEYGPRALGGRSILGDARSPAMQQQMNLKIKYRESFRPFAPAVRAEAVQDWFDLDQRSPYMLLVAQVAQQHCLTTEGQAQGLALLYQQRSIVPAITHVDGSARVQTVHEATNPRFYRLLQAFEALTGCPMLINTSFNVRGEPIVCTPEDAWRCFMRTEMDALVIGRCILLKSEQKAWHEENDWRKTFALD